MSREIPDMPTDFKPGAAVVVMRTTHDEKAMASRKVPTNRPDSYSFETAEEWPAPQAYRDRNAEDVYSAVVGLVQFPNEAAKLKALGTIAEGPSVERYDGDAFVVSNDQARLDKDWAAVTSAPGAKVLYDHVHEGLNRPVIPDRGDVSPQAYKAWEKGVAESGAQEPAKGPSAIYVVAHSETNAIGRTDAERIIPNGHSLILPTGDGKDADPYWEVMDSLKSKPGDSALIIGRVEFKDAQAARDEMLHQQMRRESRLIEGSGTNVRLDGDARDNIRGMLERTPSASFVERNGAAERANQIAAMEDMAKNPPVLFKDKFGAPTIVVTKDEVSDAIAVAKGGTSRNATARLVGNLTTAIHQKQWAKDAGGRLRETGEVKTGIAALEALRDGFGKGEHRKLTFDPQKLEKISVEGGHRLGREFAEVLVSVAMISNLRNANFHMAKQGYANEAKNAGASR